MISNAFEIVGIHEWILNIIHEIEKKSLKLNEIKPDSKLPLSQKLFFYTWIKIGLTMGSSLEKPPVLRTDKLYIP